MLKIRIIPTLLWKDTGLVKGIGFDSWRRVGPVLPAIKVYTLREVDEIILLDITATLEKRDPDYDSISDFCSECIVPLTIGGGIKNSLSIKKLLRAGADKIAINSAAYDNPDLISDAARYFGSQCIVSSIDFRVNSDGSYECYKNCGTVPTGRNPVEWAQLMESKGAGEILLTSIERDGTMRGYDIDLIRSVATQVSIPVIASGGAGNPEHIFEAIYKGTASAAAASSIFHFTEQTPLEIKKFLASKHIPVRIINNTTIINNY